ncbi:MAG TPA: adenylyl-sulfate kinase [Ignavibacteria bacterium]|nr:adenylyl-sulfate kinase [Ignavibacteria bacterium]
MSGKVLWLTGLPCSGKTTISIKLTEIFLEKKINIIYLDNDVMRSEGSLNSDLGFSTKDREENIRRIIGLTKLLIEQDINVVVAVISPYKEMRQRARNILGEGFIEVYIHAPLEVCEKRDVKDMYKKARNGEISNFTGISDPYEEPENPELIIETSNQTVEESVQDILVYINKHF